MSKRASFYPEIPGTIEPYIAWDSGKRQVYADTRREGDPLFQTWVSLMKARGVEVKITRADAAEIARIREELATKSGRRTGPAVTHLDMRNLALSLLKRASEHNASDLHLLLRETHAEVQIRVKNRLRVMERFPIREGQALSRSFFQGLAVVKDSYNPLEFQNGQIAGEALKGTILSSVRLVRGPAYPVDQGCGFVVARLQYRDGRPKAGKPSNEYAYPDAPPGELDLVSMGYTPEQATLIDEIAASPSGIVIISGPTGSGKTYTLNEVLKHVARRRPYLRTITIEDPVEHPMSWAVQMQASEARDEDAFVDRLKVTLRADPDILLIAEIRSAETAIPARDAANTGHMVWTTLHTNDPYMIIDRLEGMDRDNLNRTAICDHKLFRAFIGQRLVGELCPHCSKPLVGNENELSPRLRDAVKTWGPLSDVRLQGPGCKMCSFDGVITIRAVAEIIKTTREFMEIMAKEGTAAARKYYRAQGDATGAGKSMLENAMDLVFQGKLDPREVEESVDVIEPKDKAL
jgi:type II secretory ATPase GspE/PulE/Tfp pilus assembly ATPase PilB-like protein